MFKRSNLVFLLLSLASLGCLGLIHANLFPRLWEILPVWISRPAMVILFVFPSLVVILAAVLISTSLKLLRPPSQPSDPAQVSSRDRFSQAVLRLVLAFLLLHSLAYVTFWESIWDHTSDGLGGIWLAYQSCLAAVICGAVMGIAARRWFRSAGFFFAILVPLLMLASFRRGWSVDYQALTGRRAVRIEAALERFHARAGRYPDELSELAPRYLLWVPGQVILRGEDWCYAGEKDNYLLGVYWREHFSTPLELRFLKDFGDGVTVPKVCEERLKELTRIYDFQPDPLTQP